MSDIPDCVFFDPQPCSGFVEFLRVTQALTPEELGGLVNAIVDAVENPHSRSLYRQSEPAG